MKDKSLIKPQSALFATACMGVLVGFVFLIFQLTHHIEGDDIAHHVSNVKMPIRTSKPAKRGARAIGADKKANKDKQQSPSIDEGYQYWDDLLADPTLTPRNRKLIERYLAKHPATLRSQVLAANPELLPFAESWRKSLRTKEEIEHIKKAAGNRTLLNEAFAYLQHGGTLKFDRKDEAKRMVYVDLIRAALAYRENPESAFVSAQVSQLMKADDIYRTEVPVRLKKSLSADRLEIFRTFSNYHEDLARRIYQKMPDGYLKTYATRVLKKES